MDQKHFRLAGTELTALGVAVKKDVNMVAADPAAHIFYGVDDAINHDLASHGKDPAVGGDGVIGSGGGTGAGTPAPALGTGAAGTIGRSVVFDGEESYYQDSNIVWLEHDESMVLNRYLYFWYQLNPWKVSKGGTIERLYNDNILQTEIVLPPLSEQTKIVAKLDAFSAVVTALDEEIAARREQFAGWLEKLMEFREAA